MDWLNMSTSERNRTIKTAAHGFCADTYRKDNPGATPETVQNYTERHWRQFVPMAIDWVALCTAAQEAEQASPWN